VAVSHIPTLNCLYEEKKNINPPGYEKIVTLFNRSGSRRAKP